MVKIDGRTKCERGGMTSCMFKNSTDEQSMKCKLFMPASFHKRCMFLREDSWCDNTGKRDDAYDI